VGVGAWTVSDVRDGWRAGARYEPRMGGDERETLLAGWADALNRARSRVEA
jgi:glycerol kinase